MSSVASFSLAETPATIIALMELTNISLFPEANQPNSLHRSLLEDLQEGLGLVGLQGLTLGQQPQVVVGLLVRAIAWSCGAPAHTPSGCVVTADEVTCLLLLADVVLVQSWRLSIGQVHQACVEPVRPKSKGCPFSGARRRTVRVHCCLSVNVEARILALEGRLGELVVVYNGDLSCPISVLSSLGIQR
jgi:hypothetical protein